MRRAINAALLATFVTVVCGATDARADGFVSPWTGANFGSGFADHRASFGVSAGFMGNGIIGGEADFGYSPSFFGSSNSFGNNNVMTLMGNVLLGAPFGGQHGAGIRPYGVAGLGMIRTDIDGILPGSSAGDSDFGLNAGAGLMGFFTDHFGLKGEVRYFRTINNDSTPNNLNLNLGGFHFWRAAIGIVIR